MPLCPKICWGSFGFGCVWIPHPGQQIVATAVQYNSHQRIVRGRWMSLASAVSKGPIDWLVSQSVAVGTTWCNIVIIIDAPTMRAVAWWASTLTTHKHSQRTEPNHRKKRKSSLSLRKIYWLWLELIRLLDSRCILLISTIIIAPFVIWQGSALLIAIIPSTYEYIYNSTY